MANRTPIDERRLIALRPDKRPYGARLTVQTLAGYLGDVKDMSVLLDPGPYVTFSEERKPSWEGGNRLSLNLEGFATAPTAEENGRRLVQALLWAAVSLNFGTRLVYAAREPIAVFDRQRSGGFSMYAEGTVSCSPDIILDELNKAYSLPRVCDRNVMLSMEIFCAAPLEASDRAKFLAVVSALEPLAVQGQLGAEVEAYVEECLARLKTAPIPDELRNSLSGRVRDLSRESVRQSLRRLVQNTLPGNAAAWTTVDVAYALRSQLIHEAVPHDLDVDLAAETRRASIVIRQLYSALLKLPLHAPAA